MLNYLGDTRQDKGLRTIAESIQSAYDQALRDGQKTRDLGGTLNTMQFADAVIDRLT